MPIINNKSSFLKTLFNFTNTGTHGNNCTYEFNDNRISIKETETSGLAEIFLDISSYNINDSFFFIKIDHLPNHSIGHLSDSNKHNDGIVLKVDLINKKIGIYLFELKTTISFSKLQNEAIKQLQQAYYFINYLNLNECFELEYKLLIGYQTELISREYEILKTLKGYNQKLFNGWSDNKIPIMLPFCKYKYLSFQTVKFNSTIII